MAQRDLTGDDALLQQRGPEVLPLAAVHRSADLDAEATAARGLGRGAEQLLAGAVPRDHAAVGVDGVEQDAGLIEEHGLVLGELAGLEREQTRGEAERDL